MAARMLIILCLGACGRIGFDPVGGAPSDAGVDAVPADAWVSDLPLLTSGPGTDWIRNLSAVPGGFVLTGANEQGAAFDQTMLTGVGQTDGFVVALDSAGRFRWAASCASGAEDLGAAVTGDVDGNVYVGGTTGGGPDCGGGAVPNGGGYQAWLASYDANGVHRWSRGLRTNSGLPGNEIDSARGIAVAGARLLVGGIVHGTVDFGAGDSPPLSANYDGFLASYGLDGQLITHRRFNDATVDRLAHDGNSVYVVGSANGIVDLGEGPVSVSNVGFVAAYDFDGQYRWSRFLGDSGTTEVNDILYDPATGIHVAGWFTGQLTSGTTENSAGSSDIFVASFSTDGQATGLSRLGGSGCDRAHAMTLSKGVLAVVGQFTNTLTLGTQTLTSQGGLDGLIVMFDVDGAALSMASRGGPLDDLLEAVAPTPAGILIGGAVDLPLNGGCGTNLIFPARGLFLESVPQ